MARWINNELHHAWHDSIPETVIATWDATPDKNGRGGLFYDSIDDTTRFPFYEKPDADTALSRILRYQMAG